MFNRLRTIVLLTVLILGIISCKRMPLYEMSKNLRLELTLNLSLDLDIDIDIETDLDIEIDNAIVPPTYNKVLFYSPEDDHLVYTEFVGTNGGEISTPSGKYNMLLYSFGTEYIQIRNEGDINTIEAFTSDITATKSRALRAASTRVDEDMPPGPIIYAPDHLLVAKEDVEIPEWAGEDIEITIKALAKTIVKTYSFEVPNIKGVEYIESCEAFITNQSRSCFFGRGEISQEPATLFFPVGVNVKKSCLYTVFNTFGKLPGESKSYLHIVIRNTDGTEIYHSTVITDQFEKDDHHIVIEDEIVVPTPTGGGSGIAPTVDKWTEENHDVGIG